MQNYYNHFQTVPIKCTIEPTIKVKYDQLRLYNTNL